MPPESSGKPPLGTSVAAAAANELRFRSRIAVRRQGPATRTGQDSSERRARRRCWSESVRSAAFLATRHRGRTRVRDGAERAIERGGRRELQQPVPRPARNEQSRSRIPEPLERRFRGLEHTFPDWTRAPVPKLLNAASRALERARSLPSTTTKGIRRGECKPGLATSSNFVDDEQPRSAVCHPRGTAQPRCGVASTRVRVERTR
jgi:hypothetical protein